MFIILSKVVRHTRKTRVHICAAQFLRSDILPSSRLDQRRACQEDRAGAFYDNRLIAHGGHVRSAGCARAHYRRNLRDSFGAHARLVIEDASEMVGIGKDFILHGQKSAARIHQIDARQVVLFGNFLGAQVFLYCHRVIRSPFDGGVVCHDQYLAPGYPPDASDDPCPCDVVFIQVESCQRRKFEKWRSRIQQKVDALPDEQFSLLLVAFPVPGFASLARLGDLLAQLIRQGALVFGVGLEAWVVRLYGGGQGFQKTILSWAAAHAMD